MNWQNKTEVKRGNIGERIVAELITKHGYIHYGALTEGAHLIDFFCLKGSSKDLFCIEVKTKKRMASREATGFNTRNFKEYIELSDKHKMDIVFIFVDDFEECIYSARLADIRDHGVEIKTVTIFPLNKMNFIRKLTEVELQELRTHWRSSYNYSNVKKFFS